MSTQNQFIRIYKRASQSPWDDSSTVLLMANVAKNEDEITLDYSRYIYLHRDSAGRAIGVSLSKSIINEMDMDIERYVDGEMMYLVLLMFADEITSFCELFASEFESLFLTSPAYYFSSMVEYWTQKLDNI